MINTPLPQAAVFGLVVLAAPFVSRSAEPIDFNRDIRPILSDKCYRCHGPDGDERSTEMRLDQKQHSIGFETESGRAAIHPGDRDQSELFQRITATDEDQKMPPADSGKTLSTEEVELLGRWIDEGAVWRGHWAFIAPQRPQPPKTPPQLKLKESVLASIDRFILHRLAQKGLTPSQRADKRTLIRRLSLDLTGLAPTPQEIQGFLLDDSPQAYERVVDRLLASDRFGEQMAHYWLDAARYGDTHGLHLDNERSIWPYREWVIRAFNDNMPFDRFTIEQLAGDLLPNPTLDQRVATGFNRCNVTTSEGGSIRKEFRVRYAIDRVETTSTVWMGLTTGCAVCHEHKFDPISQQEFYELFAYFYSFQEDAMDGNKLLPAPFVAVPMNQGEEKIAQLQTQVDAVRKQIKDKLAAFEYQEPKRTEVAKTPQRGDYVWIEDAVPTGVKAQGGWKFVNAKQGPVFSGKQASTRTASGLGQHFFEGANPPLIVGKDDLVFSYVYLDPKNPPREVMLQFNVNGWNHRAVWGENLIDWGETGKPSRILMGPLPKTGEWVRLEFPAAKVGLAPGSKIQGWAFTQFDGTVYWDKAGIVTETPQQGSQFESLADWERLQLATKKSSLPKPIMDVLKIAAGKRTPAQQRKIRDYFVENAYSESRTEFAALHARIKNIEAQIKKINDEMPKTLVMADKAKPLDTFVLIRGQYDKEDKSRKVQPGVPAVLPALPEGAPSNRLGLATWLVSKEHPLTARVTVNRMWQNLFGVGIVKTSEDFGSQGEWPSHPQLLDWLAVEFMESGWDVKHMLKLMVMSSTYQQSTRLREDAHRIDPHNRLLARGPRFRMDAEMIRDNALFYSGLLVERLGGKSVKPYQPGGLWKAVGYTSSNTANFRRENGESLYRRSLYTFLKRTSPPPMMAIFDAPSREACTVRRSRTNTPQQALLLMNDEQFVEASRAFAQRMMKQGGATPETRLRFAFEVATSREATNSELEVLTETFGDMLKYYQAHLADAKSLIAVGESKADAALDPVELAAYTMAANLILNLDELVTKN